MEKTAAIELLESVDGPLTVARLVKSTRICDGYSRATMAKLLKITVQHLCDVEKGRRTVKPARAYVWGEALQYSGIVWAKVASEEGVRRELKPLGLDVDVEISIRPLAHPATRPRHVSKS